MKKIIFLALVVILISTLVLFGCKTTPTSQTTTTTTSPITTTTSPTTTKPTTTSPTTTTTPTVTPKTGGTVKRYITEPFSLGYPPTMTGQTDGQSASVGLETLFYYDKAGNMVPLLATGYTQDAAAKTITITLRKGIKFHDGSDFNAAVCKWNLDQYRVGARAELKNIASVDVVDDNTVRINMTVFDNTMVNFFSSSADAGRMISKAAFDAHGPDQKTAQAWAEKNPVGTGPFQFVSWTKDISIIWKRFDGYWGGKPYLDGVEMIRLADVTAALLAFKGGQLTYYSASPTEVSSLKADTRFTMLLTSYGQVPAMAGSANDTNFSKLKVRQAMSYAIDANALNTGIGQGLWMIQNQWAVPGTWGYNPNVVGYPYNPTKAKQLLTEAGYPNGFDTVFHYYNTGGMQTDEVTATQKFLKDVGINASLDPLARPAFADIASNQKGFTGVVRMQGFSFVDPLQKWAQVVAGNEFKGAFIPQAFKDLYTQATQAPDQATKQKLTWDLMKMGTDEYCIASFLYMQPVIIFKSVKLRDDGVGEYPYYYMSPKAWLDQ